MELAAPRGESRCLMATQPKPSEDEQRLLLRSLTEVGPSKPVGYLPLYTLRDFAHVAPESVAADAIALGLATTQLGPEECCITSGALYVYHREALARLLQTQAGALVAMGLPVDPDRFVTHIAAVWFEPDHPAYPILAAAFGDSV